MQTLLTKWLKRSVHPLLSPVILLVQQTVTKYCKSGDNRAGQDSAESVMEDLGRLLRGKPPLEWEDQDIITPEWRHRLKAPMPPMAASLQSLELWLPDNADLCHIPDYFESLVALTSLTLSAGLRVSALLTLFK